MHLSPNVPRGFVASPKAIQVLHVSHGVHAGPKAFMLIHHELAFLSQLLQSPVFKVTLFLFIQVIEDFPMKNKEASIDESLSSLWLLCKIGNLMAVDLQFTEPSFRFYPRQSGDLPVGEMEGH